MTLRGALTPVVQDVAQRVLGRALTSRAELRLMPYVDYVMKNEQRIDPRKVNQEEREVLSKWRAEGHIEGGASGLAITKEFYNAVQEILWEAYVVGASKDSAVETEALLHEIANNEEEQ